MLQTVASGVNKSSVQLSVQMKNDYYAKSLVMALENIWGRVMTHTEEHLSYITVKSWKFSGFILKVTRLYVLFINKQSLRQKIIT